MWRLKAEIYFKECMWYFINATFYIHRLCLTFIFHTSNLQAEPQLNHPGFYYTYFGHRTCLVITVAI